MSGNDDKRIRKSSKYKGLTEKQAFGLLEKHGQNLLPEKTRPINLEILLNQIKSPLIYILIFAAVVTIFLRDFTDTVVILLAVFINTILGFYQEAKAEQALAALKKIITPHAKVVRNQAVEKIEARFLVPGDLVIFGQGDRIPADGELIEAVNLSINEAILTGESVPVSKKAKEQVYLGTTIVSGRGKFVVSLTGKSTEMGKIAQELITVTQEKTPLQCRLSRVARVLALIVAVISFAIFLIGMVAGNSFVSMFTTSVAIAVAAIPEGMVVSLTVILAIGMQRILKKKALVRKLLAAETLGSVTTIASDKTGTLTEGLMKVSKVDLVDKRQALEASVFANNLEDPLEVALWEWAKTQGLDPQRLADDNPRVKETPFDSEKKYMSVTIDDTSYIKGAPEVVLAMCKVEKSEAEKWQGKIEKWAEQGLRLIGLAVGKHWLGLVGIEDPVRESVSEIFEKAERAGIRVMMVTGDYAGTAASVWKKVNRRAKGPQIIDGAELEKLSLERLTKRVASVDIFARVSPSQKLKIVEALKKNNQVVALVGDGVNDAPAIKRADIGIVVGEASDVARETADMVLLDSNFKTIVAAVEEGRGIYDNIKKVILYLLSDSFSEVVLVTLSIISGTPLPLTAAQILWINLIADGFPNLALTVEPKEQGLLKRKPVDPKKPLIDLEMKTLITIISVVTGIVSFIIFLHFKAFDIRLARSVTFTTLAVDSLLYVFSVRSLSKPIWQVNHLENPYLLLAVVAGFALQLVALYQPFFNKFLQTVPLGFFDWLVVLIASLLVIVLIEGTKLIFAPSK